MRNIVFIMYLFLILSCTQKTGIRGVSDCNVWDKIVCDFNEENMNYLTNNYHNIVEDIIWVIYSSNKVKDFQEIEKEFFNYLRELIISNLEFEEHIFLEKYNNLMNNIPTRINDFISSYYELKNNGYKYILNYAIFLNIFAYEYVHDGKFDASELSLKDKNDININKILKLKSIFNEKDLIIINDNKELMITKSRENIW